MQDSCGSCKYSSYDESYVYPFKCLKDKSVRYNEQEYMNRLFYGYTCESFVSRFEDLEGGDHDREKY